MAMSMTGRKRIRRRFGHIREAAPIPNLIEVQKRSYDNFLKIDAGPEERKTQGLAQALSSVFPVRDFAGKAQLEFVDYEFEPPKYDVEECRQRGLTYSAPLKVTLRLVVWDIDEDTGARSIRDIKEQDVYMGDMPLMTDHGTFIVNGTERVIVSQMHRSPGVFFDHDKGKTHSSGKLLFASRVIPYRGSWLDFEFDAKDLVYVRIDRRRKLPVTTMLMALDNDETAEKREAAHAEELLLPPDQAEGLSHEDILSTFYEVEAYERSGEGWTAPFDPSTLKQGKAASDIRDAEDIYRVMRPGEPPTLESSHGLFQSLFFNSDRYDLSSVGRVKMNSRLEMETDDNLRVLRKQDVMAILKVLVSLKDGQGDIDDIDHLGNRRVRSVGELMENQYRIGLLRMERAIRERMGSVEIDTVMPADLINAKPAAAAVREFFGSSQLSQFMDQTNPLSEITHKRRVSALGPGGLTRERAGFEVRDVHPTHYGRICPIETPEGPNIGLINSLATFAKINRYGFIETPYRKVVDGKVTAEVRYISAMEEGRYTIAQANAELDGNNKFVGELIPVRRSGDIGLARPTDIELMDVSPKQLVSVAAALIPFLENDDANRALMGSNMQRQAVPLLRAEAPIVGTGMEARVARDSGVTIVARRAGVIDQVDATRVVVRASEDTEGNVSPVDIYSLLKFQRSNQNTTVNQRPLVKVGDTVRRGDIIADGPSTEDGELALGRNVLVAFMPWNGYNFEDSILISERIVRDDVFTSIHIEEYEVMARDTKLGQEEITRDIPNVGEEALKNLDEAGIVYVGAEVGPGDILVGKVTPKGESPMTPEEKLLRAIFGEKASDVRDTSLKLPPGGSGTIVEVRVFSRRGVEKDERALAIDRAEIDRLGKDRDDERAILERGFQGRMSELFEGQTLASGPKGMKAGTKLSQEILDELPKSQWQQIAVKDDAVQKLVEAQITNFETAVAALQARFTDKVDKLQGGDELLPGVMKMVKVFVAIKRKLQPGDKMAGRHGNKGVISRIVPMEDMPYLDDGTPVDIVLNPLGVPSRMNVGQILETHLGWAARGLGKQVGAAAEAARANLDTKPIRKMLADIYSKEQYDAELAVMDDDQIIEQAGILARGVPMGTPVFDGAREADVISLLGMANLSHTGQEWLTDGRTGEVFDRQVTVGYIYMLKLHHLVDDKIHARSIGPYSLVTQQPLGGKAQFGGQRFGEMEVWALEAYGAAYTLQEMLTVKSDDVSGRTKVYEAIVRGDDDFESGIRNPSMFLSKSFARLA
jgi:DNA-directed RNA polymerase subunit beta